MTTPKHPNRLTLCPNDPSGVLECPVLKTDYAIATEGANNLVAGEGFANIDENPRRVIELMSVAISNRTAHPCDTCSTTLLSYQK